MIRHATLGAVGALVLGAGLALAQGADPPRPTQLTQTGVAGWSQAAGIDTGRYEFLGVTSEGVFYSIPDVRVDGMRAAAIDVRLERFDAAPGRTGTVRSEKASVEIDCQLRKARVGPVNGFADHNLKGRDQEIERTAWSVIGGSGDWAQVTRGNLLQPKWVDLCRAAAASRKVAQAAAARNKARDFREKADARIKGIPNRPGGVNRRY